MNTTIQNPTQQPANILLIEDDKRLADLTKRYLEQHQFQVTTELRGDSAIKRFKEVNPQLVILDLMLPGQDGIEVCAQLRKHFNGPILILTARNTDIDEVIGLESGADDYLKKPAEPMVLLARIRNLLRRTHAVTTQTTPGIHAHPTSHNTFISDASINIGLLKICKKSRQVWLADTPVGISTQEYEVLLQLAENAGEIMSRDQLLTQVRGIEYNGLDRTIDVYVSRLRKRLNDDPQKPYRIKTVWGKGYLLVADAWSA
ncbi:response regulator [Marinibactrum halimedae]|uniref:DNA-binding response regulator n=1 Tax=Marinibactrum halimedae TaxID=1444977 RepID=A0AA37TF92_9GAMM|nr:response regulator [Marinibactrum halimedae]MCD9457597.1 response regulator [Marinibactrum halimedae]GLS28017.1 DNA-binding response regulator [Marinibactrum halimedae]